MKIKRFKFTSSQAGVALVLSMLFIGILVSIGLVLSAIFIPKIRTSSEIKKSSAAFYAAESAVEWCLYGIRHSSSPPPTMSNKASYINGITLQPFKASDCLSSVSLIKSIGVFQGTSRSLEIKH
jgi:Tfp pilus assembly protein PilX